MKVLTVLALLAGAGPALAGPHIVVTTSTTIAPQRVRITFRADQAGSGFTIAPTLASVHFYGAESDSDFAASVYVDLLSYQPKDADAAVGTHQFSFITDQVSPCVKFTFPRPGTTDYVMYGCLSAGLTPALRKSWGSLKSTYR